MDESSYPTVIKYQVNITEGVLAHLHGMYHAIDECFIPEHGLCFNLANDTLHVFKEDAPRTEGGEEITTTASFITLIKNYYDLKQELTEVADDILYRPSPTKLTEAS